MKNYKKNDLMKIISLTLLFVCIFISTGCSNDKNMNKQTDSVPKEEIEQRNEEKVDNNNNNSNENNNLKVSLPFGVTIV